MTRNRKGPLRYLSAVTFVGMAVVACGSSNSGPTTSPGQSKLALASGETIDPIAAGDLGTLPTGAQYARVVMFHQSPRQTTASKKHQPGIIYVATGTQVLTYTDTTYTGAKVSPIGAGTGLFLQGAAHTHTDPGPTDNTWYFIALWPDPSQPPTGAVVVYVSTDIPSSTLPSVPYTETLRKVTLAPGGRSAAHRFGGVEVLYVLSGALTVDAAGQAPKQLAASGGDLLVPNTATQEIASGSAGVVYLAFFLTPEGSPFETAVSSAPAG
jgi:quercetin dioxygenase-like cupin family protein